MVDSFLFALVFLVGWAMAMPQGPQRNPGEFLDARARDAARDAAFSQLGAACLTAIGVTLLIQSPLMCVRGQTLGKMLFGIQVANMLDEGVPDLYRGVIVRLWFRALLWVVPGYALLDGMLIFNQDRRCLQDYLAATRVIKVRKPEDPVAKMRAERNAATTQWA